MSISLKDGLLCAKTRCLLACWQHGPVPLLNVHSFRKCHGHEDMELSFSSCGNVWMYLHNTNSLQQLGFFSVGSSGQKRGACRPVKSVFGVLINLMLLHLGNQSILMSIIPSLVSAVWHTAKVQHAV